MPFAARSMQAHQVRGLETPRRHRQHARASDIVRGLIDQPQIGDQVPHEAVRQDREILDHERNLAGLERVDQLVAMRVAAIQHGERPPFGSGAMQPLEFAGNPLRLGYAVDSCVTIRTLSPSSRTAVSGYSGMLVGFSLWRIACPATRRIRPAER